MYSTVLIVTFFSFGERADAAMLRMSPSQANVTAGNIINVQATVDTLGKTINNIESVIQFPTEFLEVVSVDRSSSIFSLWVQNPTFSNVTGQISFNGGVPNPGFKGNSSNIVSIVFRAKKAGTASIIFSNSAVRENDGFGTDILTGTASSQITIRNPQAPPPVDTKFIMTSSSHPDQNAWYNEDDVEVSWVLPTNAIAVRTLFNERSDSEPRIYYDSPITSRSVEDVEDGVWYFHAQYFANGAWSNVQHYTLQIDTNSPTNLSVSTEENEAGGITLFMAADDSSSGVDYFTITVGEEKPIIVRASASTLTANKEKPIIVRASASGEASLDVPLVRSGEHTLAITAFDKAGNKTETSTTIIADTVPELSIDTFPSTIKLNESIEISGTASYPFAQLRISLENGDGIIHVFKLKSNSYSEFNFISQPITDEGTYTLWVDMLGENDEILLTSQKINVLVTTPLLLQIGSYTIGLMKVLIPAAILLVLFLLITLYGWLQLFRLYRKMRKESREAQQVSNRAFRVLRKGVDRHIARMKKAKRKLTKEETAFLQEFSEKLEEAEEVVEKEIKDISEL